MIDNNELISTLRERAALYAYGSADSVACTAAANVLEAQACEIERHDIEYSVRGLLLLDTERERDQLRAELAALQCEDELPELPDIGAAIDYTGTEMQAYARQAQAMVRAKMVAALPAQPAQDVNAVLLEALQWVARVRAMDYEYQGKAREALAKYAPTRQEQKGGEL